MRVRTSLVATLAVGLVLIALGVSSWTAITSIRDAHAATLEVRYRVISYTDLQRAVAAEAVAEAGYRRAPSAEARVRLEQAIEQVDDAIDDTRKVTPKSDGPVLSQLQLLNQRYVDQVRATLDTPATGGDDRVAGPALDSLELLLDSAIDGHRKELNEATALEAEVIRSLTWLLPAVFTMAFAGLGLAWRKLLQEQRRLARDAKASRLLAEAREELLVEEQRQLTQLRELQRARNELIAMVQHDLGNPISVIGGYAEVLAESGDLSKQSLRHVEVIQERANQMSRLVNDLSDLETLSAVHAARDAKPLDLAALTLDAMDSHRPAATAKGITLDHRLGSAPVTVRGDSARLRQVLDNLVGNAVKYTPDGGSVRVVVEERGGSARVTVSDTGIGIPEDQLTRVFEKFFRASTATDSDVPGTGLGLAIARAIVEAHDGSLTAATNPPRGTTFEMLLPSASAEEPATADTDEGRQASAPA